MEKAARYYTTLGHGSFAPGNAEGGLTTLEEKSMGAYSKSGSSPISGILKPGDVPPETGLYLLDVVPDGEVRWGFPNISDIQEMGELMACGAHVTLFTTGRGSVVGSVISPLIKICANPETYRRLNETAMDINAGRILEGEGSIEEVGCRKSMRRILRVAGGGKTASEAMGHAEFSLWLQKLRADWPGVPAAVGGGFGPRKTRKSTKRMQPFVLFRDARGPPLLLFYLAVSLAMPQSVMRREFRRQEFADGGTLEACLPFPSDRTARTDIGPLVRPECRTSPSDARRQEDLTRWGFVLFLCPLRCLRVLT